MLAEDLASQEEIQKFVKGRTTRMIAITSLAITNGHIKECAQRWAKIYRILKWTAIGMLGLCAEKLLEILPTSEIAHLIIKLVPALAGSVQ